MAQSRKWPVFLASMAIVASACSSNSDSEIEQLQARIAELEQTTTSTVTPSNSTTTTSEGPEPTTTTIQIEPIEATAEALVLGMAAEGAPIDDYVAYTAATDPNELLGRPGGYSSKSNFIDDRLTTDSQYFDVQEGGSLEVYDTETKANLRSEYISRILASRPLLGTEYHVVRDGILLRISGKLLPVDAKDYEVWLDRAIAALAEGDEPPDLNEQTEALDEASDAIEALAAQASDFVGGTFSDELPSGESGEVSVIVEGTEIGPSVPIIVRNMTDSSIERIEVSGIARDSDGVLLASGSSQGFVPSSVAPGEIAFGFVFFGFDPGAADAATIEYTVDYTPTTGQSTDFGSVDLTPVEWSAPGTSVVVLLSNASPSDVSGPIRVYLACFDETGTFIAVQQDFADADNVIPGDTVPAQVSTRGTACDTFLVGASGYDF